MLAFADKMNNQALKTLIEYYNDCGVSTLTQNTPYSSIQVRLAPVVAPDSKETTPKASSKKNAILPAPATLQGTPEAYAEALKLASDAKSLEQLKQALEDFGGLSIKHVASNTVFSDGNPKAPIMIVGEAPGADEDRQGVPFVGDEGQLLDKMFAAIGMSRKAEDAQESLYISNILNWRPPGNRTPTPQEIEISLPFIEKHILLIKPKLLVFAGAVPTHALTKRKEGITKLRGQWMDYTPRTPEFGQLLDAPIKAIALYHPSYLLKKPEYKRESWSDLKAIRERLASLI